MQGRACSLHQQSAHLMQAYCQGLQVLQRGKTCKNNCRTLLLQGDLHEALEAAVPSPESASASSEPSVADEADAPDGEPAPPDLQCNTKRTYQPSNLVCTPCTQGRSTLHAKLAAIYACQACERFQMWSCLPSWQCLEGVCSLKYSLLYQVVQCMVQVRKRRHGFLARLRTKSGRDIIARRLAKGRRKVTA